MVEIHDFIDLFMIYMETKGGFVCFGIVDEKINERIVDFRKENIFLWYFQVYLMILLHYVLIILYYLHLIEYHKNENKML